MKTLADFKRRLQVGMTIHVTNHLIPERSGLRVIKKVQGNSFAAYVPGDATEKLFWTPIPKAAHLKIESADVATILGEKPAGMTVQMGGSTPFLTLNFKPEVA